MNEQQTKDYALWASKRNVQLSERRHGCLMCLQGVSHSSRRSSARDEDALLIPHPDHVRFWCRGRKLVCITSEPYQLTGREVAVAVTHRLVLLVHAFSPWNQGETMMTEWWRPSALPPGSSDPIV